MNKTDVTNISLWLWLQFAVDHYDTVLANNELQQWRHSDWEVFMAKNIVSSKLLAYRNFMRENYRDDLLTEFFAQYPWAKKVEDDPENAIIYPSFTKRLDNRLLQQARDNRELSEIELVREKMEEYATD